MTATYGIMGWPVAHTRSPALHRAAFAALGIDAVYVPFEVAPAALPDALRGLVALGVCGVNVTLPHKERALALVDEASDEARAIGAVNTIVRDGERLVGANTDAEGLVRALAEAGVDLDGSDVVVLGAGGAARAAVVALAGAGAASIAVCARRGEAATLLVRDLASRATCEVQASGMEARLLRERFARASLVVQATSATLGDGPSAAPFAATLPLDALPTDAAVIDLVYAPRETAVLADARARGLRAIDGLGMLLHQAALAFERFTGRPAPLEAMRRAL